MKTKLLLLLAAVVNSCYSLNDTIQQKTRITDVTVFFSGAQVTHQTEVKLKSGRYHLVISDLPYDLNPATIQIAPISNCKILSVKHQLVQASETRKGTAEEAVNHQIETQENRLKEISGEMEVFEIEERILMDNSTMSKESSTVSVMRMKETADFYRARLNEIRRLRLKLSNEIKSINEKIQTLYSELNVVTLKKRRNTCSIYLYIDCLKDMSSSLLLRYYIKSAGWEPLYDFRVDDISRPCTIVYNANVFQSTGENWENVKVRLSTGNPSLSGERKKLQTWYLNRTPVTYSSNDKQAFGALKGVVKSQKSGEAIPFANIAVINMSGDIVAAGTTNMDGEFTIKPLPAGTYNAKVSYIGYSVQQVVQIPIQDGKTTYQQFSLIENALKLDQVQVMAYEVALIDPDTKSAQTVTRESYQNLATKDINSVAATTAGSYQWDESNVRGGRALNETYYSDGVAMPPVIPEIIYLRSEEQRSVTISREYVIDELYTIPCDGADYMITIKEVNTPAHYIYYAVPKIESDIFLIAELTNWEELQLLSGKTSIYFKGTFIGSSFIDVNQTGDTLSVSLGRDKDVIVSREGNKKLNERKISGGNVKQTFGWNISLRNNKTEPITIRVQDQYPISEKSSVEVAVIDSGKAKVEEKTGILTWEVSVKPGEKMDFTHSYTIRYPRYSRIITE